MDAKKLVKMANEIAMFFEADPDLDTRVDGVAGHLRRFWEPRMRTALYRHLDETAGEGLRPLVAQTLHTRRAELLPCPQPNAPGPASSRP
jgi:formate dehydrogenase subunit delta